MARAESAICAQLRFQEMPAFNRSYTGPAGRPIGAKVDLALFWICTTFYVSALVVFPLVKHVLVPKTSPYYRYLEVRDYAPLAVMLIGAICMVANSSYLVTFQFGEYPCWLAYLTVIFPPMIILPASLRLFAFYRNLAASKASSALADTLLFSKRRDTAQTSNTGHEQYEEDTESFSLSTKRLRLCMVIQVLLLPVLPSRMRRGSSSVASNGEKKMSFEMLMTLRRLSSKQNAMLVMAGVFVPFIILQIVLLGTAPMVKHGCYTCMFNDLRPAQLSMYASSITSLIVCSYAVYLVKDAPDPLLLVKESKIALVYLGTPTVALFIASGYVLRRGDFSLRFLFQMTLLLSVMAQTLVPALLVLYWHMQNKSHGFEREAHRSLKRIKPVAGVRKSLEFPEVDPFTIHPTNFERVLETSNLMKVFHDHVTAEHGVESLLFYREVKRWQREYHDAGPRTSTVRAKKIVGVFVGNDAIFPTNLPSHIIDSLQGFFEQKGGDKRDQHEYAPQTFFNEAEREIFELMRKDAFYRFIQTPQYREWIAQQDVAVISSAAVSGA